MPLTKLFPSAQSGLQRDALGTGPTHLPAGWALSCPALPCSPALALQAEEAEWGVLGPPPCRVSGHDEGDPRGGEGTELSQLLHWCPSSGMGLALVPGCPGALVRQWGAALAPPAQPWESRAGPGGVQLGHRAGGTCGPLVCVCGRHLCDWQGRQRLWGSFLYHGWVTCRWGCSSTLKFAGTSLSPPGTHTHL